MPCFVRHYFAVPLDGMFRATLFDMGEREGPGSDVQTAANGELNEAGRPAPNHPVPGVEVSVERNAREIDPRSGAKAVRDPATIFEDRYRVLETAVGDLLVEPRRESVRVARELRDLEPDQFFLAEQRPDGTYGITLTEQGVKTFETALGIANDLGGSSLISPYSTIADIMERTATREDLSAVLRSEPHDGLRTVRLTVLRRKLRGSERPTLRQTVVGHIGKLIIVLLFVLWTLQQFIIAVQDITAIPGILSSIPTDILHPTASFGQVGSNISDAGHHFFLGVIGILLTYIAGALIHPLIRIYRKDAIIPGERPVLRLLNGSLARLSR
jgi:hypothetical protein